MIGARRTVRTMIAGATFAMLAAFASPQTGSAFAASEVRVVVNGTAITSGDIAKRQAFLRLQHQKADAKAAEEQLIEQTLKQQEISRVRMSVSKDDVNASFARFASGNKLTTDQMTQILERAGVGVDHFKAFIAVQMSWPRLVNARYGSSNRMSNSDLVARMMENKQKPETTEYILQQMIFVVPANKKGIVGKRKSEAEASRAKYPGCDQAKVFAATMLDVSVRDLGRVLAPELPAEWKPLVEQAKGNTTATRVTDRGVEYIAICSQRQVSDDQAAEMVFRQEDLDKAKAGKNAPPENPNAQKYMEELRKKAQIMRP
ncbi:MULTISPECIES: peptidylprolyl isomerase [Rhizobium]|uniref:Molecular chaperone SurA n=1 Tax=Rhizobium altiplani TaxID=1864509 RepID=A0A109J2B1_9HYPH|nr:MULTISPECIES: peptidylprolyl isomerase [Rhizobium]KWV41009.1 molecular chaperone SurA [Rhizobium altiplani]MBD9447572.1 peptidylprolyl isomerase [Rhizobium sp. RHZ01]MBD9451988.1 peptidylprolyl isomerase [Rhizobium sp. RHZ02]NMN70034.1 periplasmic chaperone for outer membrane proteins SurA [Rhizobium sp. 57MFTsu3.2]